MYLIDWLNMNNMKPFSREFAAKLDVGVVCAGRVATGQQKASLQIAARIEEITAGRVTARDLWDFYKKQQSVKSS